MDKKDKRNSMRSFLHLIKLSKLPWGRYVLYIAASLGISTVSVMLPEVAGEIMEGNIFDSSLIRTYTWATIVSGLASIVLAVFQGWLTNICDRNLQQAVSKKLIHIPMKWYLKMNPSSLISRVTMDTSMVSYLVFYLTSMFTMIYTLIMSLVEVYAISSKMTLSLLLVIPWSIAVCVISGRLVSTANDKRQSAYAKLTSYVADRLLNIKLIKSCGMEAKETESNRKQAEELYKADKKLAFVEMVVQPLTYSASAICKALMLVYGGILVAKGQITSGNLVTLVMYLEIVPVYIIQPIMCYETIKQVQGMTMEAGAIMNLPDEQMESKVSFALADADIQFKNVSFSYQENTILDDVSFTIPKGKVTAIVGASGAGKTTILNMLERFYEPSQGEILFGSTPISDIHLNEWREVFGYIQQSSPLLSCSIRDNICFGLNRKVSDEELISAAKKANAYDFIMELPDGFDTEVGEVGGKLSGGERQRIAIARTLIKNPDYLLLDEATSNLDTKNTADVQSAIRSVIKGRTAVVVSHNMKEIRNADNIIVIDNGKISSTGTHEEIYGKDKLYTTFCDLQAEKDLQAV
jgi:ATP-binding cassette, subfamily B, bacterial AbcA/BmrA